MAFYLQSKSVEMQSLVNDIIFQAVVNYSVCYSDLLLLEFF